ncbi:acetoacetate--CoA ligase [Thermobifida fusca]|jgi:acetoacetyl-CoA synthetase|uniref:Acetoacetyl-CoA synthetase n=3 Tax=Thermobifida fusca TaxID=2021 RepID=A0A9P2WQ86_THEFU|nr:MULTISPECIES: acetoacetate--CoA ligase [Thermobifida]AAZ56278.1 acetoacetyl-CoA synthase [Thermobifida fusca YX]EOR70729.1 acetoacetyl-CoA synthetase [Thermobifida fusca TM51]MBO2530351.1 acetoacetate--CoA ligase [Thermobifida sp.]PPS95868.1 acetoacetyl-CoA synthetase [Thermobifida fusca]PZN62558.1 MAG: acetoacetate--CoA ligase [Thermobifida fusca]
MTLKPQPPILWSPDEERKERANLTAFTRWVREHRGVDAPDYEALWRWSVTDLEGFWSAIWEYYRVRAATPYTTVLASDAMPGAVWFPGATLNYAEHIFRDRDPSAVAIRHASELRPLTEWTWGELRTRTAAIAAALRSLGVGPGDRVVAYLPNIAEATAAFLACAAIGATWSSCSPDFGVRSVLDRFAQIEPKVLLAVDGYRYGGKDFDRRDVLKALRDGMPSLQHTVVLPYLGCGPVADTLSWAEFEAAGEGAELEFTPLPFDHPLWVLYSSGTTGLPKAIVHGHGGILLEQLKNLHLHLDAHADDRVFWFTTTGWMMWNFLVSVLLTDASIVLYDGSPAYPDLGVLWDLAERAGITIFGTSAGYLANCRKAGIHPTGGRNLSALHAIGSTGSPLSPDEFAWCYQEFGSDLWLFSTSGGTDICSCLVGGVPTLPVYQGEIQARSLGMAVASWDSAGNELVGEVGELVVTRPAPSMPLYFWGDKDGSRLRDSYFSMYPGVWRHGDWIEITDRGTAIIYGRSDSTINRGGVRMGTSEIYRSVLALEEVIDALVVDVPQSDGSSRIELFVVLRENTVLDDDLVRRIKQGIREDCSPRHVPDGIQAIPAVPRTLSGKVLEVPVKRILMGEPPERVVSRDSLANPEALDYFVHQSRDA